MVDKTNKNWLAMSDPAIIESLAGFIKAHRLAQNKSQMQLAAEAGINRSTLRDFENGHRPNLLTFIQLLRSLKLLYTLEAFQVQPQISPIQLAKLEQKTRQRAGKSKPAGNSIKPLSDW